MNRNIEEKNWHLKYQKWQSEKLKMTDTPNMATTVLL